MGSAVAFAVTMLLARAAHPGHTTHAQTTSPVVTNTSSESSDDDEIGTVVPQVSTHVS